MKYQELDLYIRCDGKPLPEYQVTVDDNAKTVTCFIPSEADKVSGNLASPRIPYC